MLRVSGASYLYEKALALWDARWPNESHPALHASIRDMPLSRCLDFCLPETASMDAPDGASAVVPLVRFYLMHSPPKETGVQVGLPERRLFSALTWSPPSDKIIKIEPVYTGFPTKPRQPSSVGVIDPTLSSPERLQMPRVHVPGARMHKASPLAAAARQRRKRRTTALRGVCGMTISLYSDSGFAPAVKEPSTALPLYAAPVSDTVRVKPKPSSPALLHAPRLPVVKKDRWRLQMVLLLLLSGPFPSGSPSQYKAAVYEAQDRLGFKRRLARLHHHASVIAAVAHPRRPSAAHSFCMNDPNGDLTENLALLLDAQWGAFGSAFCKAYWSSCPEQFA
ncbi:hypothetical protein AURDEDRAFT_178586 [Auricularia subglabra TFB-10046 SS5]|uniref:Uncharacterized protein n=1 Tax=Auricularia subglabra (strain TFB-10046 / SS5) TaxID=717982 RepID=J0WKQ9_AURST|nr:hypothetical protein AURDEDRAFT_178586 [Auricularia subglabra TFB-10046 SS5]